MLERTIHCNKCGKKFDLWDEQGNFVIDRQLGYGTIYDGQTLHLHLCCDCMEQLIKECVIPPTKKVERGC